MVPTALMLPPLTRLKEPLISSLVRAARIWRSRPSSIERFDDECKSWSTRSCRQWQPSSMMEHGTPMAASFCAKSGRAGDRVRVSISVPAKACPSAKFQPGNRLLTSVQICGPYQQVLAACPWKESDLARYSLPEDYSRRLFQAFAIRYDSHGKLCFNPLRAVPRSK
jgi:hypothetical protein